MAATAQQGWPRRQKHLLAGACVAAAAGYLAYRAYNSKGLASTQATLLRAAETLQKLGAAAGAAGAALELVSNDLRSFLASDGDEVPRSLRQLAKLARCPEMQHTITACVGAALRGASGPATEAAAAIVDRLLEAVLSERGSNLVALAVSVAAREGTASLVSSLNEAVQSALASGGGSGGSRPDAATSSSSGGTPFQRHPPSAAHQHQQQQFAAAGVAAPASPAAAARLGNATGAALVSALAVLQSAPGERLMRTVISSGVGSAVGVCMDQAATHDMYGPLLAAFARPEHRSALTELAAAMSGACCREMFAALTVTGYEGQAAAGGGGGAQHAQQQQRRRRQPQHIEAGDDADSEQGQQQLLRSRNQSSGSSIASLDGGAVSAPPAAAEDGSSQPSTPQSGPTTPEPSLLGAPRVAPPQPLVQQLHRRARRALGFADSLQLQPAAAAQAAVDLGAGRVTVVGPMAWMVALFAHASQRPELRSLMLEMSASSTREFVRTLLPASWTGGSGGSSTGGWLERQLGGVGASADAVALTPELALRAQMHRIQVMLSVLMFVVLYAVSPRLMMPSVAA